MATRGSYGFEMGGVIKATYNHFDSYPECLGKNLFTELQSILRKPNATKILRQAFLRIEMVSESDNVPIEVLELYARKRWIKITEQGITKNWNWYNFLHDWQGTMLPYIEYEDPYIIEVSEFDSDCLEYEYLVDLDNESFVSRECCEEGIVFALSFDDVKNSSETDYSRLWSLMEDYKERIW